MKLSDLNFDLPKNLIAKYPTEERDGSRLMVINRAKKKISRFINRKQSTKPERYRYN